MKNTLFLCLLLFSLTIFSACSNDSVSSSKAEDTATGTEATSESKEAGEASETTSETEDVSDDTVAAQSTPSGLSITSPSKTGDHTTGYNWNVVRGLTSVDTAAIEVNGYRLQKYVAGNQYWNYIAATKMQTLEEGNNEYVIKAFDADDNVIDEITYHINYQNGHALPNVGTSLNIILFLTLIFTLNLFIRRQKA